MRLSQYEFRGAIIAQRLRERIARTGRAGRHLVWTKREEGILRCCYPDYPRAQKNLPRRTYNALRHHVRKLGIQRRRHIWTGADVVKLRRLCSTGTTADLRAAFPGLSIHSILGSARHKGIKRRRRKLSPTGYPLLDAVRDRCHQLGYSMVDLDSVARTKRYFQKAAWVAHGRCDVARLARAAIALDGELTVTWRE